MSAATIAPPAPTPGHANAFSNTMSIARRNLLHIKSDPEQIVGMTIQPLMFLVLFVFVFGGAIAGSSQQYLQFALPGIIVQGIAFTPFTTALGLNVDFQRGLIDRFRSLPIARSSVIAGRIVADTVRIIWGEIILIAFGVLLGFRYGGGFAGAIGAFLLVMAFGISLCWPMAFIGITAKTPEAVNTWGFLIILPLTFASSVFVSPSSMPGWLQPIVNLNPITKVVNATRALMLGVGPVVKPVLQSIIWMIVIVGVFAPLAVAKYRRRV